MRRPGLAQERQRGWRLEVGCRPVHLRGRLCVMAGFDSSRLVLKPLSHLPGYHLLTEEERKMEWGPALERRQAQVRTQGEG